MRNASGVRRLAPIAALGVLVGATLVLGVPALFGGAGGSRDEALAEPVTDDLLRRGAYVATLGDCAACHTASPGMAYAGGLAIATPIGTVFTTNITPDKNSGIGTYSYGDFERAVRRGIRPDGKTLYPAMPYPSYSRISDADLHALYAYFMRVVAPSPTADKPPAITWPLSMRWPLTYWRWLFSTAPQNAQAATGGDPAKARGEYLVEGLGHCGACHTPRGPGLQEKALGESESHDFLSGGLIDHYVANDLRGDPLTGLGAWSEDEIATFLKLGHNAKAAAFGGMTDVVIHSTQGMTDDDRQAIAHYLKSLPASKNEGAFAYDKTASEDLASGKVNQAGALVYLNNCAACHLSSGQGYADTFPALAGNPVVNAADPSSLIGIVLHGARTPSTASAPTSFAMPGFSDRLSDDEAAQVITFIRANRGNHGGPVSAAAVGALRPDQTQAKSE
jgi:mono/diheme cytochrome c family protein